MAPFPKWLGEALTALALLTIVVWIVALCSDDVGRRLAVAGNALGAVASIVALGTAAIAIQGVRAQHSVIVDDHARQHNARLRDLYAEYFGQAYSLLFELRTDLARVSDAEEAHAALLRAKDDLARLTQTDWRIRMNDGDQQRRTGVIEPTRDDVSQARGLVHKALLTSIDEAAPLSEAAELGLEARLAEVELRLAMRAAATVQMLDQELAARSSSTEGEPT